MKLPKDLRYIPLKYDGTCLSCSRNLRAGEKAHWSPSSKKVWCRDCARVDSKLQTQSESEVGSSRSVTRTSKFKSSVKLKPASVDTSQTQWRLLCKYAQRCVEAEAAKSLVPYVKEKSLWFTHPGEEQLVIGQYDTIPATVELAQCLSQPRRRDGQSIIYGWPTVVITDRDNAPKVAPLFVVHIDPERDQNDKWILHATAEPEFNLAITASGIFDPSITEDIQDLLSGGLPFGDADALAILAGRTAYHLGLVMLARLNPKLLDTQVSRKQGIYNAAITVVVETGSEYQATLREELRQLQTRDDWTTTAAAFLLPNGLRPAVNRRPPPGTLAAPLPCNQSQEETLEQIRRKSLTVVTGPPGTGKTQLVVNAVTNAWLDSENVLVTSTNNAAVDVAVDRAERDVCKGLLVRTGNREAREQIQDRIFAASAQAENIRDNQSTMRAKLKQTAKERALLMEKLARLDKLDKELLMYAEEREELDPALKNAARALWGREDSPKLSISSREIERRARRLMRAWLFLRFRIRRLSRRVGCSEITPLEHLVTWARIDQRMTELTSQLKVGRAERIQLEHEVGDPTTSMREANQKWANTSLNVVRSYAAARIRSGADRLAAFGTIPPNINRYRRAIANSFSYLQGWACTALSAHSNFNLESGLFDLVIVDEASQCSLAAVLPLAYRAKRLVLVGDPNQLNPIVSLSDSFLQEIAKQTGLDNGELREQGIHHKDGSAYHAFEFASRPEKPILINEHFRCHPHIARWFNKTFYRGELTVLTDVSDTDHRDRAIFWYDVEGVPERPRTGSWINQAEAEQTVEQLLRMLKAGCKNIGVVAPFVAQAQLIAKIALRRLGQDVLDDISFVSGTAHRLQGDEREAIIFSSVLSPGMSKSGARWIEKERNLLNVAVSRARRSLIVIGHPSIGDLGSPTLYSLRAYLREVVDKNKNDAEITVDVRTDSRAEELLLAAMQLQHLLPYAKLNVEGYELDFALMEQGINLNIEVDGDQHMDIRGRQRRQDVTRDRVLSNLGWTVLRIPAWRCHEELESVIDEIKHARDLLLQKIPNLQEGRTG